MNVFDQGSRFATSNEPEFVLTRVSALARLDARFRGWFNAQTVPLPRGPDRIADLIALMDDPASPDEPWLLVHEFQSSHDPKKLGSMLIEAAVFREHARDPINADRVFRVLPVLVYLHGECPKRGLDMRTPNGLGIGHFPVVWEMEKDSALQTLRGVEVGNVTWGALFWTPLMAGGGTDEVLTEWLRLLDSKVPEQRCADVGYVALQFAELAGCRIAWDALLENRDMVESMLYRKVLQQGQEIAQLRTKREDLLLVVNSKFAGAVPAEYLDLIRTQESYPVLDAWFQAALDAENAQGFLAVLRR